MRTHGISAVGPTGRKMRRDDEHDGHRDYGRGCWCATDGD
jgi:hypothetical protein